MSRAVDRGRREVDWGSGAVASRSHLALCTIVTVGHGTARCISSSTFSKASASRRRSACGRSFRRSSPACWQPPTSRSTSITRPTLSCRAWCSCLPWSVCVALGLALAARLRAGQARPAEIVLAVISLGPRRAVLRRLAGAGPLRRLAGADRRRRVRRGRDRGHSAAVCAGTRPAGPGGRRRAAAGRRGRRCGLGRPVGDRPARRARSSSCSWCGCLVAGRRREGRSTRACGSCVDAP